jgi:arylsulfatase A-like enzyme
MLFVATPVVAAKPKAIVLLYADDLGYGDTSAYGQSKVPTPNLEKLADEGCLFCDAHSATPICTPSRYSLLTGRYAFRRPGTRILDGDAKLILPVEGSGEENVTLPVLMKRAGYRTAAIGKWHLGLGEGDGATDWNGEIKPSPREVGFDRSFVMAATADRVPCVFIEDGKVVGLDKDDPIEVSYDAAEKKWDDEITAHTNPELLKAWGSPSDRQHDKTIIDGISRIGHMRGGKEACWKDQDLSDRITAEAEKFITDSAGEPIFLYFATNDIHVPRDPNPRFRGRSGLGIRGDATVQMDDSLGRIRKALEENGYSDTLFIATSDNGPRVSDGYEDGAREAWANENPAEPFRGGKYTVYEGGTRVPMIVAWPGRVKPGMRSNALISQTDFARSLAKIAGVEVPEGACGDSRELSYAILGESGTGRESLVEQPAWGPWGYRKGSWKLIDSESPQLYNLDDDPGERNNLAEEMFDKVEELRAELRAMKKGALL